MNYYQLVWTDGKTEVIKGKEFRRAFNMAGYGNGALKLLKSHQQVEASDAETIEFMKLTSKVNGFCPNWANISAEGKAQWRERATEHKFKNFNTLPQKFPRIQ